ncbi:hypothetical protein M9H77_21455 [Catharanthus roseus]|uniref:Uncharacterized protein n=1 Tax=Catharanthus roseus TaxID=4058 RepID=A0ACC0AQ65_CATRO|nr:hypothetical protein M9H77_21455 [Catharanthus roseus]
MDSFIDYLHDMINLERRKKKARMDDDDDDDDKEEEEEEVSVKHKDEEEEDGGIQHNRRSASSMYNMSLLEAVGMTPTGKTFTLAIIFMQNEKAETYEWKDNDKNNPVIAQLCYNVSHLALKIIKDEIKRAAKMLADLDNLCRYWVRTSHMLPCSCELLKQYQMYIPLKLKDLHIFWRSLEINRVIEMHRATQNILHHVIPLNPECPVSYTPPTVITG